MIGVLGRVAEIFSKFSLRKHILLLLDKVKVAYKKNVFRVLLIARQLFYPYQNYYL